MVKKITAAAAAIIMLLSLAGCSSKSAADNIAMGTRAERTQRPEAADTTTAVTTEAKISETSSRSEKKAEQKAEKDKLKVFECDYFSFEYNSQLWRDMPESKKENDPEETVCSMIYTRGRQAYNINFNISVLENDIDEELAYELYEKAAAAGYEAKGYTVAETKQVEIGGQKAVRMYVDAVTNRVEVRVVQYIAMRGGKQYVICFATIKDKFDEHFADFEKVLDTFKFAE